MLRLLLLAVLTAGTIAHSALLATPAVDAADEARPNRLASLVAEDVSPTELRVFAHYVYNATRCSTRRGWRSCRAWSMTSQVQWSGRALEGR